MLYDNFSKSFQKEVYTMDKEIMKGSIDILLLSLLSKKDMYGYGIVKCLKENSNNLYNMSEGTLYPALKRLEKNEWIQSYWEDSGLGGRRKYYKITDSGKKELSRKLGEWKKVNDLIKITSEGFAWIKILNPILIKL
jgi:PadR family transcriptional regulator, regulatory protein PadR